MSPGPLEDSRAGMGWGPWHPSTASHTYEVPEHTHHWQHGLPWSPLSGSSALPRRKLAHACMDLYSPGSPSALSHPSQGYHAPALAATHVSVLAAYSPMAARGWHCPACVSYSSWSLGQRQRKDPSTFSQSAVPHTATISSHSFTSAKQGAAVAAGALPLHGQPVHGLQHGVTLQWGDGSC